MQSAKSRYFMCIRDWFKKIIPTLMDKISLRILGGGRGERGGGAN